MATVGKPITKGREGTTKVAQPTLQQPKPLFLRSWFGVAVLIILVAAHIYGWQIARIDPGRLIEKSPNIARFLGQLLQPDIIGQDQKQIAASIPIVGTETAPGEVQATNQEAQDVTANIKANTDDAKPKNEAAAPETYKVLFNASAGTVTPGQTITVNASGLRPNTPTVFYWQNTGTNAYRKDIGTATTDAQGAVSTQIVIPNEPDRVVNTYGFPNTLLVSQTWGFGDAYPSQKLEEVVRLIIETIFLALMGTTFAVFISIPLSFLASHNLMSHNIVALTVYSITRTVLNLLRSIEVLILAIIFAVTVGLGPFAGVLALTIHSIASLGKLYSEAIEAIDSGPIEAITATGANRLQVVVFAVVPQIIPQFLSFTLYRWDINVRMSTVLGFVGGGGIGYVLQQDINLSHWSQVATALWAIAIVVIAMDYLSARLRSAVI